MEQERIPFDIKYRPDIEAGQLLVETREGRPVRIICWDRKSHFPIVALVQYYESETEHSFTEKGEYVDSITQTNLDLFLVPNPDHKEPTTTCSTSVDWAAFRREAAKDFVGVFLSKSELENIIHPEHRFSVIKLAVFYADELIKQLKEGKK